MLQASLLNGWQIVTDKTALLGSITLRIVYRVVVNKTLFPFLCSQFCLTRMH